ncbi:hypothetical protein HDU80_007522 [Chytriomyces hyalinus]|nr:hypothetical protein HDU80_007522 [Chytriomyces hyalinus]
MHLRQCTDTYAPGSWTCVPFTDYLLKIIMPLCILTLLFVWIVRGLARFIQAVVDAKHWARLLDPVFCIPLQKTNSENITSANNIATTNNININNINTSDNYTHKTKGVLDVKHACNKPKDCMMITSSRPAWLKTKYTEEPLSHAALAQLHQLPVVPALVMPATLPMAQIADAAETTTTTTAESHPTPATTTLTFMTTAASPATTTTAITTSTATLSTPFTTVPVSVATAIAPSTPSASPIATTTMATTRTPCPTPTTAAITAAAATLKTPTTSSTTPSHLSSLLAITARKCKFLGEADSDIQEEGTAHHAQMNGMADSRAFAERSTETKEAGQGLVVVNTAVVEDEEEEREGEEWDPMEVDPAVQEVMNCLDDFVLWWEGGNGDGGESGEMQVEREEREVAELFDGQGLWEDMDVDGVIDLGGDDGAKQAEEDVEAWLGGARGDRMKDRTFGDIDGLFDFDFGVIETEDTAIAIDEDFFA